MDKKYKLNECPKCGGKMYIKAEVITEYHDAEIKISGEVVDGKFVGETRDLAGSYYVSEIKLYCGCGFSDYLDNVLGIECGTKIGETRDELYNIVVDAMLKYALRRDE